MREILHAGAPSRPGEFFLHRNYATMPESHRMVLGRLRDADQVLAGRSASMIVDDDMRNIFALTSLLEEQGMIVESARQRTRCDPRTCRTADIDVVLMDIMMPEIDGIETIREIRKILPARTCRSSPLRPRR